MINKHLYFFTATFPYGVAESFIEPELQYLAKKFNSITIFPKAGTGEITRTVPENCKVMKTVIRNRWQHYVGGAFCHKTFIIFLLDFFSKHVFFNVDRLKAFTVGYFSTNKILRSQVVNNILKEITTDDVMYFYWGKGFSFLTPFITNIKAKKVVRFHGEWDLWRTRKGMFIKWLAGIK